MSENAEGEHLNADIEMATSFLTPKRKSSGLVSSIRSLQTFDKDQVMSLYSKPPPSLGCNQLQQLCKPFFDRKLERLDSKDGWEKSDMSNNASKPPGNVLKPEPEVSGADKPKSSLLLTQVHEETPVDETFIAQTMSQLSSAVPPMEKVQDRISSVNRRRHTSSTGSSNSADGYLNGQSRCSVCDGCSSSTSSTQHTAGLLGLEHELETKHRSHHQDPNNITSWATKHQDPTRYLLSQMQEDIAVVFDSMDSANQQLEHTVTEPQSNKENLSMSNEQLLFLMLRVLLTKYRCLMDDMLVQKRVTSSQKQTMLCLIQAVLVLVQKVNRSDDRWTMVQREIATLKRERRMYQQQQKRMFICLCVVIAVNLCSISAVRSKFFSIVRFFGVVETAKKVNRTRKMIADNWRNIPSLLTEFWSLFIFRSQLRLKNS